MCNLFQIVACASVLALESFPQDLIIEEDQRIDLDNRPDCKVSVFRHDNSIDSPNIPNSKQPGWLGSAARPQKSLSRSNLLREKTTYGMHLSTLLHNCMVNVGHGVESTSPIEKPEFVVFRCFAMGCHGFQLTTNEY